MFDVCYECDGQLIKQKGTVYGYWGDVKIEFVGLPKYQCNNCAEFYLDEKISILTQELTRAFSDANDVPKIIDIGDCYEILSEHLDEVYDMIRQRKVCFVKVDQNFIINCKDVNSLFDKEKLSVAARNIDQITPDVEKEIALLVRED